MQTGYLEALVNRQHRVLARRLHCFCLYDALFLTLQENPLWLRHQEPALADLQEAVLICSLPPERFLRAALAPRTRGERLNRWLWKMLGAHLELRGALAREFARFAEYLEDFDSRPRVWQSDSSQTRQLSAPWILSLAAFIEAHSNMREREIMTAPIGQMFWKAEAIAERRGISVGAIMTDEEIAIGREQKKAMEESGEQFPDPPDGWDEDELP